MKLWNLLLLALCFVGLFVVVRDANGPEITAKEIRGWLMLFGLLIGIPIGGTVLAEFTYPRDQRWGRQRKENDHA